MRQWFRRIFRGVLARRLILSFTGLGLLAVLMALGSAFLVQFTDRTLSQVTARAEMAALGARIRSESLTLTDLARRYTLLAPSERPAVRELMFEQQLLLDDLIGQAFRQTIYGDEAEFRQVDQIKQKLYAFIFQANRLVETFESERALGPATNRQLNVLINDYQDPLLETIRSFEQFESERVQAARAEARRVIQTVIVVVLAIAVVVLGAVVAMIRIVVVRIINPLILLHTGVEAFRSGKLEQPVQVSGQDEIGGLASAFNAMSAELRQTQLWLEEYTHSLERRVDERTAELQQRAVQLETSSQVARQVTSILDLNKLLAEVVSLIQVRFGYYFVGVWLVSDKKDRVVLQAGAGATGEELLEREFSIPVSASSIIVSVCKTGADRLVDDVSKTPDYLEVEELRETRSELALPLQMAKETIGVLDILSNQPSAFGPEDRLVLQTLADQIAIAIRNARLYQAEQARRRLAESLEQAGRELSSSLDMREVPGRVLEKLAVVVPYERGSVMLEYGDIMRIVAQRGFPDDERARELLMPIREGDVFQQIVASDSPVLVDDVAQTPGWRQVEWLPLNLSWMGVPLVTRDKAIGMLSLTRREAAAFTQEDATLASAFAGQAAVALENARLYDELNSAYQTLERLDRTKSDFIEVAAHELRTPLTVIKGYAQALQGLSALAENDDVRRLLAGILTGANRLHGIVNSMLDVTKIDSQSLRIRQERTALLDIIEGVRAEFEPALEERQLTLAIAGVESLPLIEADPDLLYKVFYHLVVNAIKYTPDGGSIEVSGSVLEEASPGDGEGAVVEIVVSDTGIGIDPAHHELIFEKFFQTGEVAVHSSGRTKFKGGGPGLGLAIAKGIVLAHGGKIWVESEGYDEERCPGSRFYVRLPL